MRMELSMPAVDVLWDDLRLGGVPFPLEVRGHGDTVDERARIKVGVYAELERRGLTSFGRPAPEVEDALRLLARPEVGVDLVGRLDPASDQPVKAVAVARGRRALRAVQREPGIVLTEVRDTAIIASIIELLPQSRPGPGRSVTVPASVLRPGSPHRRTVNPAELRLIASITERPLHRVGQLGIMLRDDRGGLRRLPGIGWFDTDQGRYATTVRRGGDGADWTTLSPVDNARLAHRLAEDLATALRGYASR